MCQVRLKSGFNFPSLPIRVYQKGADGDYHSAKPILDASKPEDMKLYVQAVTLNLTDAGVTIGLSASKDKQNWTNSDSITVHTFQVTGARNVPDFAIYEYTAEGGALAGGSWFVSPHNGTDQGSTLVSQYVFWTGGGQWGKVRFLASSNYTWAFDVAIVKVDPAKPSFNTFGKPWANRRFINSTNWDTAMLTQVSVSMAGPTRGPIIFSVSPSCSGLATSMLGGSKR